MIRRLLVAAALLAGLALPSSPEEIALTLPEARRAAAMDAHMSASVASWFAALTPASATVPSCSAAVGADASASGDGAMP